MRYIVCFFLMLSVGILTTLAQDIPQELRKLGFSKQTLVSYESDDGVEFYTFWDYRTEEEGDIITVVVEEGKIQEWYEGVTNKVFSDSG